MNDLAFQVNGKIVRHITKVDKALLEGWEDIDTSRPHAMLLIHGFTSVPGVYQAMRQPLIDKGYSLACPQLAGHGQNFNAFELSTPGDWYASVESAYLKLKENYDSVNVIGFSLGGLLATELASKQAVERLTLFAPAFELPAPIVLVKSLLRFKQLLGIRHFKGVAGNVLKTGASELAYHKIPIKPSLALADYIKQIKALEINVPTDVFLGRRDKVVSSKKLAKYFSNKPHAQITVLDNSAHLIPIDNDFEQVMRAF